MVVWWCGGVEGLGWGVDRCCVDTQVSRIYEFIPRWECLIGVGALELLVWARKGQALRPGRVTCRELPQLCRNAVSASYYFINSRSIGECGVMAVRGQEASDE